MDEKFFERILRCGLDDNRIKNVTINSKVPAVEKGANYLSEIWRFTLGYSCPGKTDHHEGSKNSIETIEEREIRLIVKCLPTADGPGLEAIKQQNIFETELKIFRTILPETERLVGRRIAPKCFFYDSEISDSIVVLEDLEALGFKTIDRQRGLSMAHVLMVLEIIANFHAASVYQYEKIPDMIKSFKVGIFSEATPRNMYRILEQTLQMICDKIRDWPDSMYRKIADKLDALKDKFEEELPRVTDYDDTEFCVLNHGDCWINNIMFREDEQQNPLEVMLIDYQMPVYSSPVIDLIYFLSVCPAIDIKTDNDDYFIEKYLEILSQKIRILGCKTQPPTIVELRRAMLKRRMWIVTAALTFHPRMLADSSDIETFDELLESGETRMNIFKNPNVAIALKKLLPWMEVRGYLD